jgi:hypothetical protein
MIAVAARCAARAATKWTTSLPKCAGTRWRTLRLGKLNSTGTMATVKKVSAGLFLLLALLRGLSPWHSGLGAHTESKQALTHGDDATHDDWADSDLHAEDAITPPPQPLPTYINNSAAVMAHDMEAQAAREALFWMAVTGKNQRNAALPAVLSPSAA